jgi:type 1 fimbriae regulatory protein FimB
MALAPILQRPSIRNVPSRPATTRRHTKDYLTAAEMDRLLKAAKRGRYGTRDHTMLLVAYRHGLRVSELVGLRVDDVDLDTARLWVKRLKGSLSMTQPVQGDTLRLMRQWLHARDGMRGKDLPWLFLSERGPMTRKAVNYLIAEAGRRAGLPHVHPHMLRHSCGFYLAEAWS